MQFLTSRRLLTLVLLLGCWTFLPAQLPAQETTVSDTTPADSKTLQFSFRQAPWDDVLQWLAEESDLSFSTDVIPTGTFNYIDRDQRFTPKEAIDLVNGYLLIKGYTIVRKGKMLLVIDLEDELDAQLVRDLLVETPVSKLKDRGEYEITKTRFDLNSVDAAEAEQQISQLLSPVGSVVVIPGAKQIMATETGGTLRVIQEVLASLEKSALEAEKGKLHSYLLKVATADEVLAVARPLLDIGEDDNSSEDGSIRISADPLGRTVFATGEPEKIKLVEQIVNQVDTNAADTNAADATEASQFIAHKVATADSQAVLRVLQTLFVGDPAIRMEIDASTGGIIAFAKPDQHRAIQATIAEMEQSPERVEVIPLRYTQPAAAVVLVEKLFGNSQKPPIVDGTLIPPQLVVRGTESQIDQIREVLGDLGERIRGGGRGMQSDAMQSGNIRMIPMTPENAAMAIERIQSIFPTLNSNEIKIVTPSREGNRIPPRPLQSPPQSEAPSADEAGPQDSSDNSEKQPREASKEGYRFNQNDGSFQTQAVGVDDETRLAQSDSSNDSSEKATEVNAAAATDAGEEPPILITRTRDGLIISSQDIDALNTVQSLVQALTTSAAETSPRFTLFYLKHIEAEEASTLVTNILNGFAGPTSLSTSTSDGEITSVLQQQSNALATELPSIVADKRLNALFVSGEPSQVAMVKQLLQVIDIESGPEEVLTFPKPYFIPVLYADAETVASVLRQVYANRIETGNNNRRDDRDDRDDRGDRGGRGFPFFGRGGDDRRGGGGDRGNQQTAGNLPKMSIGVDAESNSIVVAAPGPLLKEVESVVQELDRRASEKPPESIAVVNLKRTDPYLVQQTLAGVLGDMVESSTPSNSSSRGSSGSRRGSSPSGNFGRGGSDSSGSSTANDFINRLRSGEFGRGGFDRGSRGERGGSERGGSERGGRDRGGRGR